MNPTQTLPTSIAFTSKRLPSPCQLSSNTPTCFRLAVRELVELIEGPFLCRENGLAMYTSYMTWLELYFRHPTTHLVLVHETINR